jgi:hypothetical protein
MDRGERRCALPAGDAADAFEARHDVIGRTGGDGNS